MIEGDQKTNSAYGTSTQQPMIRMENGSIMGMESDKRTGTESDKRMGTESNREQEQEVTEGWAWKVK